MARISLLIPVLLAGCGPVIAFDKPGTSVARLGQDLSGCEAQAFQLAPPNVVQQTNWRRTYDYRPVCIDGKCGYIRDYRYVPETRSVDLNAGLRRDQTLACMQSRGYGVTELPRCTTNSGAKTGITAQTQLASVSETACVVDVKGYGPVIRDSGKPG